MLKAIDIYKACVGPKWYQPWRNILWLVILLLLLSRFSRVRLCAMPQTAAHQAPLSLRFSAAHQAPLSLRFSRHEHWSGLPFPSPMLGSEKWKWSRSVVSDSQRPHGLRPTRLLCPWDFPGKSGGVGRHCTSIHRRNFHPLPVSLSLLTFKSWLKEFFSSFWKGWILKDRSAFPQRYLCPFLE